MRADGDGRPRHGAAVPRPACAGRQDVAEFAAGIGHNCGSPSVTPARRGAQRIGGGGVPTWQLTTTAHGRPTKNSPKTACRNCRHAGWTSHPAQSTSTLTMLRSRWSCQGRICRTRSCFLMDKYSSKIDIDPDDVAESLELPGADLSNEELSFRVIPRQAVEFTCSRCFLVHHPSQLAEDRNGQLVCRECAA